MIPYGKQTIKDDDIAAVANALEDDYLTTGPKVAEFEKKLSDYVNARHCIAVNSGTSALDIAVASLNLPKNSEIITTPFTFAASSNCILYNNCKPVFADIEAETHNINPDEVRKRITKNTKAIIFVDYAGHPCEINELRNIADEHDLYLIEDAAHSLGAEYNGDKVGGLADLTAFSFHPVKIITTGEGGAVTTNNDGLNEKLRMLRNHGIDKDHSERVDYIYDMKMLGRNYRITDFQCALGMNQLSKVEDFIKRRSEIAKMYNESLSEIDNVKLPHVKDYVRHAWHLYTILLDEKISRDKFFYRMREKGVGVNVHYIPVYKFAYYKKMFGEQSLPVVEDVASKIISLPIYPTLKENEIDYVIKCVKKSVA